MVIDGFRTGAAGISDVEMELDRAGRSLSGLTDRIYHRLLGEEAAFLCDCVTLNILQRSDTCTIYDSAVANTDRRIQRAGSLGTGTKFNLNVFVNVMFYEGRTYFSVICGNRELLKAFRKLEPYSLTEAECQDPGNRKFVTWQKIHAMYSRKQPLSRNMTCTPRPDPEKIVFPDKKTRCASFARQTVMNSLLREVSTEENVEPFLLMRYMEYVMELMLKPETEEKIRQKEMELEGILLDFSEEDGRDMIFSLPGSIVEDVPAGGAPEGICS